MWTINISQLFNIIPHYPFYYEALYFSLFQPKISLFLVPYFVAGGGGNLTYMCVCVVCVCIHV